MTFALEDKAELIKILEENKNLRYVKEEFDTSSKSRTQRGRV